MDERKKNLIMAVDAGGTGIRAFFMNQEGRITAQEFLPITPIHPEEGATEYDPMELWEILKKLIQLLVSKSKINPEEIAALGITNQRSSFCFWDKATGEPLSPVISWQDVRAADTVDRMNRKFVWRLIRKLTGLVSRITNNTMMTATSLLELTTDHTMTKVRWLLDRDPFLCEKCKDGSAAFGTLDSWFIYKLTGGKEHVTDVTNASSTTMYNPFDLFWNPIFCKLFKIPMKIFPRVKDSSDHFGYVDPSILGAPLPIACAIGDQQSSLFGHGCFSPGEVKISMGSGAFVNINVGPKGKVSRRGLFPLIAWRVKGDIRYMLEGQLATLGTMIDWTVNNMGWFSGPEEINRLAAGCPDSGGVFLIPSLTGIRFPYFQPRMKVRLAGLGLDTNKARLARALLDGFAHRLADILEGIKEDTGVWVERIKVDGGVSRSDELLQTLADLTGSRVERSPEIEVTGRGAAYLAGLEVGFWKDQEELKALVKDYAVFAPCRDSLWRQENRRTWKKQVNNAMDYYKK